jgi:hypothetical protein
MNASVVNGSLNIKRGNLVGLDTSIKGSAVKNLEDGISDELFETTKTVMRLIEDGSRGDGESSGADHRKIAKNFNGSEQKSTTRRLGDAKSELSLFRVELPVFMDFFMKG